MQQKVNAERGFDIIHKLSAGNVMNAAVTAKAVELSSAAK